MNDEKTLKDKLVEDTLSEERLSQNGAGIDEEGIVNFLSDAIGQEVGTEVLREFSHSDAFAELLDVVTSSLVPSGTTSRRESIQKLDDSESCRSEIDFLTHQSSDDRLPEDETGNVIVKPILPKKDLHALDREIENSHDYDSDNNLLPNTQIVTKKYPEQENESSVKSSKKDDRNIEDTLKIKTTLDPHEKCIGDAAASIKIDKQDSNQCFDKQHSKHEISQKMGYHTNDSKNKSLYSQDKITHYLDDLELKQCKKFGMNPCCVVLCDLKFMGSIFQEEHSSGADSLSKAAYSIKNPVRIPDSTIEQTHRLECLNRLKFIKNLNGKKEKTIKPKNLVTHSEEFRKISQNSEHSKRQSEESNRNNKIEEKETKQIASENTRDGLLDISGSSKTKNKKEKEFRSTDETDAEKLHTVKKTEKKHRKEQDVIEASSTTDNEFKTQEFGRRRDKDDIRARKFDKFEYERQRKFSDKKKERHQKEIKAVFNPESFATGKTFANTFRIPKKNTNDSYGLNQDVKVSTPLAKQEIPSENLKFERFKKGSLEKNTDFKKTDWKYKNKNNKFNMHNTEQFAARQLPSLELPKLEPPEPECEWGNTTEPENECWENEPEQDPEGLDPEGPDAEGSLFGGRSTDSPLPPLSEVQVGDLAVEVTELLLEGENPVVHSIQEFCDVTDTTAQKCAWWFKKMDNEPPLIDDFQMEDLEQPPSSNISDNGSDLSFVGNVSNSGDDNDCQVNEISSTGYRYECGSGMARDVNNVDEYCGRSLLVAKIRSGTGDTFQNIFELRSGALYEKDNFQAKCNLCNQLIVGRKDLAIHVRGNPHKEKLRRIGLQVENMEETTAIAMTEQKIKSETEIKKEQSKKKSDNVNNESKKKSENSNNENKKKSENSNNENKKKSEKKDLDKEKSIKIENEESKTRKEDRVYRVKREPIEVEMEFGRTSTGLAIKVPVLSGSHKPPSKRRSRSPIARRRSRSRHRSRSRSRERRRRRSPIRRIPRSPTEHIRRSQRSRSPIRRSPPSRRSYNKQRSTSEDKVKEFLARTKRSKSPTNGHHSKRGRRSRTKSRSPQLSIKKDNREFHEKLALTADGKWTEDMERRWKLMEAQEAMFREQFYDKRKSYISTPEEHPKYAEEWTQFWERRYQEVESQGKDPDSYDYVSEWKEYWSKRLTFLLQEEADIKIREIKKKYSMDFESLNKLRKVEVSAAAKSLVKIEPRGPSSFENSNVPVFKQENEVTENDSNNGSVAQYSTMSISSIDQDIKKDIKTTDTQTINNKKTENSKERKPSVTVEDFKSTWEALTRPKFDEEETVVTGSLTDGLKITPRQNVSPLKTPEASDNKRPNRRNSESKSEFTTTSSDASYDFDGFDLVQVLRLMCKCEDQLSFLAPKVLEYFKMAEEMELAKHRGSHTLLDNEELVTVLFQSRDRFMTMIRSNVLSREILKSLNLTVYALNAILDAPQCQRFRPKLPITLPELESPDHQKKQELPNESLAIISNINQNIEVKQREPTFQDVEEKNEIVAAFCNIPVDKKDGIATTLTEYLISVGRECISDIDLGEFLRKFLVPITQHFNKTSSNLEAKHDLTVNNFGVLQPATEVSNNLDTTNMFIDDEHSISSRLHRVSSSRVIGSALPTLPHMAYRVATTEPRVPVSYLDNHSNEPHRTADGNTRPESRTRNNSGGRRSPFSRRDYSGNPVANTGRL